MDSAAGRDVNNRIGALMNNPQETCDTAESPVGRPSLGPEREDGGSRPPAFAAAMDCSAIASGVQGRAVDRTALCTLPVPHS